MREGPECDPLVTEAAGTVAPGGLLAITDELAVLRWEE